jgi:hypothetical protein
VSCIQSAKDSLKGMADWDLRQLRGEIPNLRTSQKEQDSRRTKTKTVKQEVSDTRLRRQVCGSCVVSM